MKLLKRFCRCTPLYVTKDLTPQQFIELAAKHPSRIKQSKFIVPQKFGAGFTAKVRVVFE
jgi:hypothetical protein